jgi:hypothetical protein
LEISLKEILGKQIPFPIAERRRKNDERKKYVLLPM